MSEKNSFHEVFQRFGGSLCLEGLHTHDREICSQYLEIFRGWVSSSTANATSPLAYNDINFDFVDNNSPNAVAIVRGGAEYVGIFLGLIANVHLFVNAFMADPEVFTSIGKCRSERRNPRNVMRIMQDVSLTGKFRPDISQDAERRRAADILCLNALSLIFFHEVGHITRGHLEYMRDQFFSSEIPEFSAVPLSDEEGSIRRALEFDADRAATQASLTTFMNIASTEGNSGLFAVYDPAILWAASVTMTYCVLDVAGMLRENRSYPGSHPPIWVRFATSLDLAGMDPRIDNDELGMGFEEAIRWWARQKLPTSVRDQSPEKTAEIAEVLANDYNSINDVLVGYQVRRSLSH